MYKMMSYRPVPPMFADPFFQDFFGAPRPRRPRGMHVRVSEEQNAYIMEADLPGVGRENIRLSVEDNVLTIAADRGTGKAEADASAQHTSHVERSFTLEGINVQGITADYVDGVLKVLLPKEQPAEKPEVITIAIGGGEQPALTDGE
ncbi:MAG: Hsp20 family protein [Clostridiales bacterium]|nr:Hsp20 family protein [Clostridiales bacterium]